MMVTEAVVRQGKFVEGVQVMIFALKVQVVEAATFA